jgi:hypothetical protein
MQTPDELRVRFQNAIQVPKEKTMRSTSWIVLTLVILCAAIIYQKGGIEWPAGGAQGNLAVKQLDLNLDDDPFFQPF